MCNSCKPNLSKFLVYFKPQVFLKAPDNIWPCVNNGFEKIMSIKWLDETFIAANYEFLIEHHYLVQVKWNKFLYVSIGNSSNFLILIQTN